MSHAVGLLMSPRADNAVGIYLGETLDHKIGDIAPR